MHNDDDLIGSAEATGLFFPAIDRATFNRWAAAGEIAPALSFPGKTGARLYRRADVLALAERKRAEFEARQNAAAAS